MTVDEWYRSDRLGSRCLGFLDLQENRVVVAREEKGDTTVGADAADADDLDRQIAEGKTIESAGIRLASPADSRRLGGRDQ
jgi:hypothetical protein